MYKNRFFERSVSVTWSLTIKLSARELRLLTTLVAIANTLTVSVDELLCDTVLASKPVFEKEAREILEDCNEYEIRVLVDVLKATKTSMRTVKMFEAKLNEDK